MTHYIQSYYDGTLYEYSKEPKEGFEEHKNSKGDISYRKYYNYGVKGQLVNVSKHTNQRLNNREELTITLNDGGDEYRVTFPVLSNDGTEFDKFTESIVRHLPSLNKGTSYTINNWRMNKGDIVNGDKVLYTKMGVSFKEGEEKVPPALSYQSDNNPEGDIPKVEWKELAGKNRPTASSKEKKLEYLYNTLNEQIERLSNTNAENKKMEPVSKYTADLPNRDGHNANSVDDDDLPF